MNDKTGLTTRQQEILELVAKGLTNQDICGVLHISSNTVKVHLRNIYSLLQVANRTEAVTVFRQQSASIKETSGQPQNIYRVPTMVVRFLGHSVSGGSFLVNRLMAALAQLETVRVVGPVSEESGVAQEASLQTADFELLLEMASGATNTCFVSLKQLSDGVRVWSYAIPVPAKGVGDGTVAHFGFQIDKQFERISIKYCMDDTGPKNLWFATMGVQCAIDNRRSDQIVLLARCLEQAIALVPTEVWPLYGLGSLLFVRITESIGAVDEDISTLWQLARRAMQIDPRCQYANILMGYALHFSAQPQDGLRHFERARQVNPFSARATIGQARLHFLRNQVAQGRRLLEWYQSLAADYADIPSSAASFQFGHHVSRQFEQCVALGRTILAAVPDFLIPHILLVAALVNLGRLDEAKQQLVKLKDRHPNFDQQRFWKLVTPMDPLMKNELFDQISQVGFLDSPVAGLVGS